MTACQHPYNLAAYEMDFLYRDEIVTRWVPPSEMRVPMEMPGKNPPIPKHAPVCRLPSDRFFERNLEEMVGRETERRNVLWRSMERLNLPHNIPRVVGAYSLPPCPYP